MLRRFAQHFILRTQEPFRAGQLLTQRDAEVLNRAHSTRVGNLAKKKAEREREWPSSQQELEAWVASIEPGLLAGDPSTSANLRKLEKQGLERAIEEEAEAELQRQIAGRGAVPTQAQREKALETLRRNPRIVERAREAYTKARYAKQRLFNELLDDEEGDLP